MRHLTAKTFALIAMITLGTLMSTSAHAAIVRSSSGEPVTTKDGCLINNWEGNEDCKAAKADEVQADNGMVVYFDFNKSTLTPQAKKRLDRLAHKLRWEHEHWKREHMAHADRNGHKHQMHDMREHIRDENITIVGYADRLGNASYNHKLALHRAESVRNYLSAKGAIDRHTKVEVRSLGSADSHSSCPANMPRNKLINCLRTDRRVEIELGHHHD